MNKKLLGTAIVAASTVTSGCGILETLETVNLPNIRFDSNSYVVQPGDTLESVASRYKIDPDSLQSINSLQLAKLVPGQRLVLLRDDEMVSMAARSSRATGGSNSSDRTRLPIGGVEASGVGQSSVVVPNATQTVAGGSAADSTIISTDVVIPPAPGMSSQGIQGTEEIIGVVDMAAGDDLLDDQPIFVPDSEINRVPVAEVARPEGVETIIEAVNVDETVAMVDPAQIPSAGTIELIDAKSEAPAKRITVNNRAGGWNWPAIGTITGEFDLREINRQGLDIDPGPGAAVQAAADGEVVYSGRDLASYGNLVILRHDDNFLSAYSKVSDIFVEENQRVKAGDLLASVGGGESGSNEIHFEIRRNGEPVNPIDYLPAL